MTKEARSVIGSERPAKQRGDSLGAGTTGTMQISKELIKNSVKDHVAPGVAEAQAAGIVVAPIGTSENPSSKVLTLANVITFCRLLLTLAFLVLFVLKVNRPLAITLYVTAALTDFLDGQVARRTQTVSWTGKIMDPIMDRVLLFVGVLGLILTDELPLWTAVFVIGRDAFLFLGNLLVRRYVTRPIDVVYVGKVATAMLMTGFGLLLLGVPVMPALDLCDVAAFPGFNHTEAPLGIWFVYVGLVFSALAAVVYSVKGIRLITAAKRDAAAPKEA